MSFVSERGGTIWLTGLSGAGKTTTAVALRDELVSRGRSCVVIDGDDLRRGLSADLGFSASDRDEQVRRAGELALLLSRQGLIAIVSLISPRAHARQSVRELHATHLSSFLEAYIATPLEICEQRDPKLLYRRARAGEGIALTGVDDPYEVPTSPDVTVTTESNTPTEVAQLILNAWGDS